MGEEPGEVIDKTYITAEGLLRDSFRLAAQILASGFRPSVLVALWRGGAPIGIAVQEYLEHRGVPTDHIAIRTSSYQGIDQQQKTVRVHGIDYLVSRLEHEDRRRADVAIEHADDVAAQHALGEIGLVREPLLQLARSHALRVEDLERHVDAADGVLGAPHRRHASAAQRPHEHVPLGEHGARHETAPVFTRPHFVGA